MTDLFQSSDTVRSSGPLRHAQHHTFDEPIQLEHGGELPRVTVAYETYGQLSPQRDNAVLICHALSGDSHVAQHDPNDAKGWWDVVVGPGKCIDTDRWFVICPNILGGCRGTTGPNSINPKTGRPYGGDFPLITVRDMVDVQWRLVQHLGIERLRAVVGGSLGGHMALQWGISYPDRVRGVAALATSPRVTSQALAFDVVGRNAIRRDPEYADGQYYGALRGPSDGLAIARMLGHITYLSREAMMQKFDAHRLQPRELQTEFETVFSVGSYLAHQGDKFVERFDANSYLRLTLAMDLFDLGNSPERLAESLSPAQCRWLLLSYSSDWLFPPFQSREIVNALIANNQPVSYCNVNSDCGHDAFLLPNELPLYGEMVRAFLCKLQTQSPNGDDPPPAEGGPVPQPTPKSLFRHHRLDYDSILNLIPPEASVLDLGCGTGGLLARLSARGHRRLVGIELDEEAILACVRRGLDVVHADLNDGLKPFADGQFDFVVLSQTLQAVLDVEGVVAEMLRVGRRAIVSFPNLGYRPLRAQLADEGRAPRVLPSLGYQWYDSPDLRFLTIADFDDFCREKAIQVHQRVALDTESGRQIDEDPNANADVAIFVISRPLP